MSELRTVLTELSVFGQPFVSSFFKSHTVSKLFKASVLYMLVYSDKPLKLFIGLGVIFAGSSLIGGIVIILYILYYGIDVPGWASLIVSLYFIGGIIITNLGIIGYYLGQNLDETRRRPIYLISDATDARINEMLKNNISGSEKPQ